MTAPTPCADSLGLERAAELCRWPVDAIRRRALAMPRTTITADGTVEVTIGDLIIAGLLAADGAPLSWAPGYSRGRGQTPSMTEDLTIFEAAEMTGHPAEVIRRRAAAWSRTYITDDGVVRVVRRDLRSAGLLDDVVAAHERTEPGRERGAVRRHDRRPRRRHHAPRPDANAAR